jgi:hypothetical protein
MKFDPYEQWFGIAPGRRPPDHYTLLGLTPATADPDRVRDASLNRLAVLRKYQAGRHQDLTQRLMNEVAAAERTLSDPSRREAYDFDLSVQRGREEEPESGSVGGLAIPGLDGELDERRAGGTKRLLVAVGVTALLLSAGAGGLAWWAGRPGGTKGADQPVGLANGDDAPVQGGVVEKPVQPVVPGVGKPAPRLEPLKLAAIEPWSGLEPLRERDFRERDPDPNAPIRGPLVWWSSSGRTIPVAETGAGLAMEVPRSGESSLFLPTPKGPWRLLVGVRGFKGRPGSARIMVGGFESSREFAALQLESAASDPAVGNAASTTHQVTPVRGLVGGTASAVPWTRAMGPSKPVDTAGDDGIVWLDVVKTADRWRFRVSNDGEDFQAVAEGTPQAVACEPAALGVRLITQGEFGASARLIGVRVEGTETGYATRLKDLPSSVPLPNGDGLASMFPADFGLEPGMAGRLKLDFGRDRDAAFANLTRIDPVVPWSLAPAGWAFRLDHLNRLTSVTLHLAPPAVGKPSPLKLRFAELGEIQVDRAAGTIIAGSDRWTLNPAPAGPTELRFSFLAGRRVSVDQDGKRLSAAPLEATAASPPGNPTSAPAVQDAKKASASPSGSTASADAVASSATGATGPANRLTGPANPEPYAGQLRLEVGSGGGIHLFSLSAQGRFDALSIWLDSLAGKRTALTASREKATEVAGAGRRVSGIVIRRRLEGVTGKLELPPGRPVPLPLVNTPADELDPFLEPDLKTLHFARRQANGQTVLTLARRPAADAPFDEEGHFGSLDFAGFRKPALTPDGRTLLFERSQANGEREIFVTARKSVTDPFGPRAPLAGANDPGAAGPSFARDGKTLWFERLDRGGGELVAADFSADPPAVTRIESLGFPPGFTHASVTADGKTMFLQGPGPKPGQWRLHRSRRGAVAEKWGTPQAFPPTDAGSNGVVGDQAPWISPDGTLLLWMSDRVGGQGGMDLWAMTLPPESEIVAARKPEPGDVPEDYAGPLAADWLMLGPIPYEQLPGAKADRNEVRFIRFHELIARRKPPATGEKLGTIKLDDGEVPKWGSGSDPASAGAIAWHFFADVPRRGSYRLRATLPSANGIVYLDGRKVLEFKPERGGFLAPPVEGDRSSEKTTLQQGKHRILVVSASRPSGGAAPRVELLNAETDEPIPLRSGREKPSPRDRPKPAEKPSANPKDSPKKAASERAKD